jgi:hypothetical protein
LFKNISKKRGTLLAIRILPADKDIKKDYNKKNFPKPCKDLVTSQTVYTKASGTT